MPGTVLVMAQGHMGDLHPATWDAVSFGHALEPDRLVVGIIDPVTQETVHGLASRVPELRVVECAMQEAYSAFAHCTRLDALIRVLAPDWIVIPGTYQGRDYAPRIAARHGCSLASDVVAVDRSESGVRLVRSVYQGRLQAVLRPRGNAPRFITVEPAAFRAEYYPLLPEPGRIERLRVPDAGGGTEIRVETPFKIATRATGLAEAQVVVAVGRGIGGPEHVAQAARLAELLGGELAASRPVCDEGWLPAERQIGSSGLSVSPRLYIALGISGAVQHTMGMRGSGCVVAVNKDPHAPIFRLADVALVGDVAEVLPALVREIERAKPA